MADCAVVPQPTVEQLIEIARYSVESYHCLFNRFPAVAFLSFSTRGSSLHGAARLPAEAAARFGAERPDLRVAGEVQADAALVPEVARAKGIDWGGQATADVLIFPDLASGNIGHKLVERLGGWRAIGPWLQGLRRPVCDLSRGSSALDIVDAAVLVCLLAQNQRKTAKTSGKFPGR
jgi:phosphotransacetylase